MRLKFDADLLKKAFSNIESALSKDKESILSYFCCTLNGNSLLIHAANEVSQTSVGLLANVEGDILEGNDEDQSHVLTFLIKKEFADIVKNFTDEVVLDISDKQIVVKNGRFITRLKTLSADGYPFFAKNDSLQSKKIFSMPFGELKKLLKGVVFAAMKEEDQTREFTGVLIECVENKVYAVATNRSMLDQKFTDYTTENFYGILEREGVNQLSKIHVNDDKIVDFYAYFDSNQEPKFVSFSFTDTDKSDLTNIVVIIKIISGKFPNYSNIRIYNQQDVHKIAINAKELLSSLEKVYLIAKTDKNSIISFVVSKGQMQVSYQNSEGEITEDTITLTDAGEYGDGTDNVETIKVSLTSMIDFLRNTVTEDTVNLYWKLNTKPMEFYVENKESFVIVPIAI